MARRKKKEEFVKPVPAMTSPVAPIEEKVKEPVKVPERLGRADAFLNYVAGKFPWLKKKMKEANMDVKITDFIAKSFVVAFILAIFIAAVIAIILDIRGGQPLFGIPVFIVLFPLMFLYAIQLPRAKASRRGREIDKEILFAGRHLWIALKGGMPLFDSMLAVSKGGYGEVSREMNKLVERVLVGVPVDVAAAEIVEDCPSSTFRRMLMQIVNSIRSGADVSDSLDVVLEQISKEQLINMKEYGQRLNPIVMFYMVLGIIVPSLGISVGVLLLSFAGLSITINELWALIPIVAVVQYLFLSYSETTRPIYEV